MSYDEQASAAGRAGSPPSAVHAVATAALHRSCIRRHCAGHARQTKNRGNHVLLGSHSEQYIDKLIGALIRWHDEQLIAYPRCPSFDRRARCVYARSTQITRKPMLDRKGHMFFKRADKTVSRGPAASPSAERRERARERRPLAARARQCHCCVVHDQIDRHVRMTWRDEQNETLQSGDCEQQATLATLHRKLLASERSNCTSSSSDGCLTTNARKKFSLAVGVCLSRVAIFGPAKRSPVYDCRAAVCRQFVFS